jgi:hypothetical protein
MKLKIDKRWDFSVSTIYDLLVYNNDKWFGKVGWVNKITVMVR